MYVCVPYKALKLEVLCRERSVYIKVHMYAVYASFFDMMLSVCVLLREYKQTSLHVRCCCLNQSFDSIFPLISPMMWLSSSFNTDRSATTLWIRKNEFKNCNSWFRIRRYRMALMWSAHLLRNSLSLIRCNSWRIRVRFFSRGHCLLFFADMLWWEAIVQ